MNKEQFLKAMTYLTTAYDKEFTKEQLGVWYDFFINESYDNFKKAIKNIILKNQFMPSIAELKEELNYINNPQLKLSADNEWLKVINAIKNYGIYKYDEAIKEMTPLTRKVIKQLGGWQTICQSTDGDWLRKNFINIYDNLVSNVKEQYLLENKKLIGEKND